MSDRHTFITNYLYFEQEKCEELLDKFKSLSTCAEACEANFSQERKIVYIYGCISDGGGGMHHFDIQEWMEALDFPYFFHIAVAIDSVAGEESLDRVQYNYIPKKDREK